MTRRAAAEKSELSSESPQLTETDIGQLFGAVAQSAHTATSEQQERVVEIINNARREIYGILGED